MNVLLLKAWLAQHAPKLIDARLRDVLQLDRKTLVLQLANTDRSEYRLLVSILESYPALALVDAELTDTQPEATESGFVKALRFHLVGAGLTEISQEGFDRSVCFEFARKDIYGRETQRMLRVELVGRASNAYLLSEKGMVISMFKPVPAGRNTVRRVVTGRSLPPPPPLGKFVAAEANVEELQQELASAVAAADPVQEVLSRRIAGGDVHLWPRIEELVEPGWSALELHAFIRQIQSGALSGQLFGEDANAAVVAEWRAHRSADKPPTKVPVEVNHNRLAQIEAQLALARRAEELEQLGVEMLQRASSLSSREMQTAYLKGWQLSHSDWADRIAIVKSAEDNAGVLIEYAQRLKRARPKLEEMIAGGAAAGAILAGDGGDAPPAIGGEAAPQDDSATTASRQGGSTAADPLQRDITKLERAGVKYLRYLTSDGIPMLVGQSDRSNDELVRHYGSSRHLWLHVRDYPGSHVLLLSNGRDVPQRSLEEAAVVAGYHSQGRGETELEVSYTPVKQLRRPKGGKPGQVLKLSEKVVRVNPMRFEAIRDRLRL